MTEYNKVLLPDVPQQFILLGFIYAFLLWLTQIFVKITDAYALTVYVEVSKVFHRLISVSLLLAIVSNIFIHFNLSVLYFYHYLVTSLFIVIIWMIILKSNYVTMNLLLQPVPIRKLLKEFYQFCSPLFIYNIAGILFGLLDIWLVQKYFGSKQTGFYGLAYRLSGICFLFTSAMTPLILREFSHAFGQNDMEQMKRLYRRLIPMLYAIAAFFALFACFNARTLVLLFTDKNFLQATTSIAIMTLYPIHQTYGQLSGSLFYATGRTQLYRNIGLFNMTLSFFFSLFFIIFLKLGANGLAIKMLLGQFIGVNLQIYFNCKFLKLDYFYFLKHQVLTILFFAGIAYISIKFNFVEGSIFYFILSGVIYTVLSAIGLYIFPQILSLTREEIRKYLVWV